MAVGFVVGVLAVCAGVFLAALDSPEVRDKVRLERAGVVLVAVAAASLAVGVVQSIRGWIVG